MHETVLGELNLMKLLSRRDLLRLRFWYKLSVCRKNNTWLIGNKQSLSGLIYDYSYKQFESMKDPFKKKQLQCQNWCTYTQKLLVELKLDRYWNAQNTVVSAGDISIAAAVAGGGAAIGVVAVASIGAGAGTGAAAGFAAADITSLTFAQWDKIITSAITIRDNRAALNRIKKSDQTNRIYSLIKTEFKIDTKPEMYLQDNDCSPLLRLGCNELIKLRLNSHKLAVETSKWITEINGNNNNSNNNNINNNSNLNSISAIDSDEETEFEINNIIGKRFSRKNNCNEYLIEWKDYSSDYNKWIPENNLSQTAYELISDYNSLSGNNKCCLCNLNIIEDEVHYLFHCPAYSDYRIELYSKLHELSGGTIVINNLNPGNSTAINNDRQLIELILGSGLSTMNSNCRSAIKSYLGECSIRREKLLKERIVFRDLNKY